MAFRCTESAFLMNEVSHRQAVPVVPDGDALAACMAEVLDAGGLADSEEGCVLSGRERRQAPVGPADGQQGPPDHPVSEPVHEVIGRVGTEDRHACVAEGAGKQLGKEGLGALRHPGDVSYHNCPVGHAVHHRTLLDGPDEPVSQLRHENIQQGIKKH
eukprot:scaffold647819_cov38-Prasinocladus_malaysianus.AAC.3